MYTIVGESGNGEAKEKSDKSVQRLTRSVKALKAWDKESKGEKVRIKRSI